MRLQFRLRGIGRPKSMGRIRFILLEQETESNRRPPALIAGDLSIESRQQALTFGAVTSVKIGSTPLGQGEAYRPRLATLANVPVPRGRTVTEFRTYFAPINLFLPQTRDESELVSPAMQRCVSKGFRKPLGLDLIGLVVLNPAKTSQKCRS